MASEGVAHRLSDFAEGLRGAGAREAAAQEGRYGSHRLYWKNATAEAVGEKHGVTDKELKQIAPRIKTLTKQMNDDRKAGKLRYRDLPYDEEMVDASIARSSIFATAATC